MYRVSPEGDGSLDLQLSTDFNQEQTPDRTELSSETYLSFIEFL